MPTPETPRARSWLSKQWKAVTGVAGCLIVLGLAFVFDFEEFPIALVLAGVFGTVAALLVRHVGELPAAKRAPSAPSSDKPALSSDDSARLSRASAVQSTIHLLDELSERLTYVEHTIQVGPAELELALNTYHRHRARVFAQHSHAVASSDLPPDVMWSIATAEEASDLVSAPDLTAKQLQYRRTMLTDAKSSLKPHD